MLNKLHSLVTVKRLCGAFFIGLAAINMALTWYNVGFKTVDLFVLLLAATPFLVNKKIGYLCFGLLAGLVSLYLFLACLLYSVNQATVTADLFAGFALTLTVLLAAVGMIYVGMKSGVKGRFALV